MSLLEGTNIQVSSGRMEVKNDDGSGFVIRGN